jgi:phosphoribosylformimino-5-aminoimidazole carboxamide ribotide isomerase
MIAIPAVDIREGRCVQLVGGRPDQERVSLPDPVAQAKEWWKAGFGTLHVVDLDAALSLGDNLPMIQQVVKETGAIVQVGGGIRNRTAVEQILTLGAERVIVGTRAIDDPGWLRSTADSFPKRVVVAADIRDGRVVKKGWTESTGIRIVDFLRTLEGIPVAGILCTDVSREGRMQGIDLPGAATVIEESSHPVWISGGITTLDELRALDEAGAAGAVLGMALYTGTLNPAEVAREFGT